MKWKSFIGVVLTISVLAAYLVVSTGFADIKQQSLKCKELRITVCDSLINNFTQPADIKADIKRILTSEGIKTVDEQMCRINTCEMAQLLNKQSILKNTAVYTSIDGILHIDVYQRRPIMRLQRSNSTLYIDESGYIFPLPNAQTVEMPVITGAIPTKISNIFRGEIPENETFLQQAYRLALYLDGDDFWLAQVARLEVVNENNVRVIPIEGKHLIDIGSLENFQYKFKKLEAFYAKVCQADDSTYQRVDLRYGNQIVCTKRK